MEIDPKRNKDKMIDYVRGVSRSISSMKVLSFHENDWAWDDHTN
jgi:hypothetical protein